MSDQTVGRIEQLTHTTPGPWRVQDGAFARKTSNYDRTYRLAVLGPAKNGSSPTVAYGVGEWGGEGTANAHLIAAAPQLLDALREMIAIYDGRRDLLGATTAAKLARAEAAIAKAEGRS